MAILLPRCSGCASSTSGKGRNSRWCSWRGVSSSHCRSRISPRRLWLSCALDCPENP